MQLPQDQLRELRSWLEEFYADAWGAQIEKNAFAGKFGTIALAEFAGHKVGKSNDL